MIRIAATALLLVLGSLGSACADDEPGSQDNPLVTRFQGANIVYYKQAQFDEAALLKAPHDYGSLLDRNALKDRKGPEWQQAEGKVTRIRYAIPAGRSSLEVIRNYETALKAGGFTTVFACADADCFAGKLKDPYLLGQQIDTENGISTAYFDHARYLLAQRDAGAGAAFVSVLVGEDKAVVTAFVQVVEPKPIENGLVAAASPEALKSAIASSGKVSVYGLLFDFNKADLKPESKPTLDVIAKLLTDDPRLKLEIVGHTDNKGTPDYNLNLSSQRAASVVAALTGTYGIDPVRLTSSGAGMTTPIATNDTEEGRAKNRRVELRAK